MPNTTGSESQPNDSDSESTIDNHPDEFVTANMSWDASTQAILAYIPSPRLKELSETRTLADVICDLSSTCDKACQEYLENADAQNLTEEKEDLSLPDLLNSDANLFTFAGIHSLELVDGLIECVSDLDIGASTNKMILPVEHRILLTMRNLVLIRPPFLKKKKQLSREEALETADIARARVREERVIQILREYNLIRGPIPWSM
ncbi:Leucyl/phenylalanyl-tRNA--protein transferase, partial [Frankliniella fusca]